MAADFTLSVNNAPLDLKAGLQIPADASSKVVVTIGVPLPLTPAASGYKINTSAPFKISPVQGMVDALGKANFTVGPMPTGWKGDLTVTVTAGHHKQAVSFDVRFV